MKMLFVFLAGVCLLSDVDEWTGNVSSVHVEQQRDWMMDSTFVSDVDEWTGNVSSVHVEQQYDWTINVTYLSNVDERIGTVVSEGYTYWEPISNMTRRSILVQDNMTYWKLSLFPVKDQFRSDRIKRTTKMFIQFVTK